MSMSELLADGPADLWTVCTVRGTMGCWNCMEERMEKLRPYSLYLNYNHLEIFSVGYVCCDNPGLMESYIKLMEHNSSNGVK